MTVHFFSLFSTRPPDNRKNCALQEAPIILTRQTKQMTDAALLLLTERVTGRARQSIKTIWHLTHARPSSYVFLNLAWRCRWRSSRN